MAQRVLTHRPMLLTPPTPHPRLPAATPRSWPWWARCARWRSGSARVARAGPLRLCAPSHAVPTMPSPSPPRRHHPSRAAGVVGVGVGAMPFCVPWWMPSRMRALLQAQARDVTPVCCSRWWWWWWWWRGVGVQLCRTGVLKQRLDGGTAATLHGRHQIAGRGGGAECAAHAVRSSCSQHPPPLPPRRLLDGGR
jgi:hypothetical protein